MVIKRISKKNNLFKKRIDAGKKSTARRAFKSALLKRIHKFQAKKIIHRGGNNFKMRPVLVLDFGSQYTQLIARRVRENKIYSRIVPYNMPVEEIKELNPYGLILSGGPDSVYGKDIPLPDKKIFDLGIPVLGICYGLQIIAHTLGGKVKSSTKREYGKVELFIDDIKDLFHGMPGNISCWMSHGDALVRIPHGFVSIAHTGSSPIAAVANRQKKFYGVQFHPEVVHTYRGSDIIGNFLYRVCNSRPNWIMDSFITRSIEAIRELVGNKKSVLGLSGGVDSSVTALLVHKAIKQNLHCIFIDNGLLRKDEAVQVRRTFKENFKMNVHFVNAGGRFLSRLKGVTDPEKKRKIIGDEFIKVFEQEAKKFSGVEFLGQGTIYPDVIESVPAFGGPSAKIKSHHNVGGLPLNMKLKLIEPLRDLFKDEVRDLGRALGLPDTILHRQPFPGPGLAIRILGEVTAERVALLQEVDRRVIEEIREAGLYNELWQSFAVLLPVKSVGVMGDKRSYDNVVALRCVSSKDGMTADWAQIPYEILGKMSNRIINEVKGVNRVVYDISSKPPATIEWE